MQRTDIRLALPSKGRLEQATLDFLASAGLRVDKPNPRQYFARLPALPGLTVMFQRPGVKTLIDSTFATPVNQCLLDFGIDLVVHSATKYLSGHNDLLAGVVIGKAGLIASLRQSLGVLGGVSDPHNAVLLLQG